MHILVSCVPKMRKEKRDEVVKLILEGYANVEIKEKTGVSSRTISKIRKEIDAENAPTEPLQESAGTVLSSESISKLGHLQAMYGAQSPDETIEIIFEDLRSLFQLKYRFDNDVDKTPSEVLSNVVETNDDKIKAFDNIINAKNDNFQQRLVFRAWELDPKVNDLFEVLIRPESKMTLLKFMETAVLGAFEKIGFNLDYDLEEA